MAKKPKDTKPEVSKEYVHSLVGGPPVPDKEPKYEYKNVYMRSA